MPEARKGVCSKQLAVALKTEPGISLSWEDLLAAEEYKCWQLRGNDLIKMQVGETKKYPENLPYEFLRKAAPQSVQPG